MQPSADERLKVFVSYSRKDGEWLERVQVHLKDLERRGLVELWADTKIQPGTQWRDEINNALDSARVAVLLISADFIASDFIADNELPPLLARAEENGVVILPLILSPSRFEKIESLSRFMTVNPPSEPLIELSKAKQERYLVKLSEDVLRAIEEAQTKPAEAGGTGRPRIFNVPFPRNKFFTGRDNILDQLHTQFVKVSPMRLHHGAEKLLGREDELAALDEAWNNPTKHIFVINAWGGVGKTSLVVEWMARRAAAGWQGVECVFVWSFYSQGTREQGTASADTFITEALKFFGDEVMSSSSPEAKGTRLAHLVAAQRTLLVLDGLEPLQHSAGSMAGQIKAPAIGALLMSLVQRNQGLCLVTTRENVAELTPFHNTVAPVWKLDKLSTAAGVELLKTLGVRGTEAEFQKLVEDVEAHALTLNLLGGYLAKAYKGDIRRRDQLKFEKVDAQIQGGHAFKTLAAYEKWLAEGGKDGACQLAVLRLLGLFERPAELAAMVALRKPPVITGLTDLLEHLQEEEWNIVLTNLVELGLVRTEEGDILNCHPLLREYFQSRVRNNLPKQWKEAHRRLSLWFANQQIQDDISSPMQLRPRQLAIEHSIHAGDIRRCCYLMFSPISTTHSFSEWLIEWGHLTTARLILDRLIDIGAGQPRGPLLIARSAVLLQLGRHQEAIADADRAVSIFKSRGHRFIAFAGFLSSILLARFFGISTRLGAMPWEYQLDLVRAIATRGNVHRETGRSSDAEIEYDQAMRILKPLSIRQRETGVELAKLLENRATVRFDLGHWSRALEDLENADAVYKEARDLNPALRTPLQASLWTNRGIVYAALGQHKLAFDDLERAHTTYFLLHKNGRKGFAPRLAHVQIMLGSLLSEKGENSQSLSHLEIAVNTLEQLVESGRNELESLLSLASLVRGRTRFSLREWQGGATGL